MNTPKPTKSDVKRRTLDPRNGANADATVATNNKHNCNIVNPTLTNLTAKSRAAEFSIPSIVTNCCCCCSNLDIYKKKHNNIQ